jgi:hypothetical protein
MHTHRQRQTDKQATGGKTWQEPSLGVDHHSPGGILRGTFLYLDTLQKCHFTLGFCKLNFLIAGVPVVNRGTPVAFSR